MSRQFDTILVSFCVLFEDMTLFVYTIMCLFMAAKVKWIIFHKLAFVNGKICLQMWKDTLNGQIMSKTKYQIQFPCKLPGQIGIVHLLM